MTKLTDKMRKNAMVMFDALNDSKIIEVELWIGIVCVAAKEGLDMHREKGYSSTSVARIRKIFPSKTKKLSDEEINELKKDDVKFFSYVYDGILGNCKGTTDGYGYRGGGPIQFTGKKNYEKYAPDFLENPLVVAYSITAGAYATSDFFEISPIKRTLLTARWGKPKTPEIGICWAANITAGLGRGKNSAVMKRALEHAAAYQEDVIDTYNEWWFDRGAKVGL